MNYVHDLKNVKSLCRICLTQGKHMIFLNSHLENVEKNPLIIEILEEVLSIKVMRNNEYPKIICSMCLGLLKISYNFKMQFKNSEKVLQEYFKNTLNPLPSYDTNENCELTNSNEPSPVQIIVGCNKYDLKDILIVEEEKPDETNFKGFLSNLGKTVTAKFVEKSRGHLKNLQEEEPVVLIEKLETEPKEDLEQEMQSFAKGLDKFMSPNTVFVKNLGLENLCDIDQELFKSALNMKLRCDICNKFYSTQGRYRTHLELCKKLNGKAIPFTLKCHLCSRIFKEKKFLNYHMKTTHNGDPPSYCCDICGQALRNKKLFLYHKLTKHGERKFACNLCDKKFYTSNNLKYHIQRHTLKNTAQCVCPVCGKTFHYKGGLFYHMKLHTNERKYSCEYCDKKFYTLNASKRHTLTHTGVRPYPCKYCEKRFFSTGEVRKHEYLHTGVRPYTCQYCNKGFCSSYNRNIHLLSHPGPYVCKFCNKTFITMNVLQYHHKTKHAKSEMEDY